MRRPFTLYKEPTKSGLVWYVRFWDDAAQKYNRSRSTGVLVEGKKERRFEAEEAARRLLDELKAEKANIAPSPQALANVVANTPLVKYLADFWTPNSEYVQYKRDVKNKPLTNAYVEMNHEDVRRHVEPFPLFEGVTVGTLNKAILKKWMIWLAGRKIIYQKKDGTITEAGTISGRRANTILQSVRVAIRWAVDNDEIPADPFRKLGEVSETEKEKGVLSFEERLKLTKLPIGDYRTRLFMLLGSYCGLRRGEMRGLKWGDITNGIIHVQHNFLDKEGLKQPKCNSKRKVPITSEVQKLLDITREKTLENLQKALENVPEILEISPESYVLESPLNPGKPLSNNFFREGVKTELCAIGINKKQQRERFLTCHSLRHTFVTLAQLSGIEDVVIRALTGQKSAKVMARYSHVPQVIDFDDARRKLETQPAKETKKTVNL